MKKYFLAILVLALVVMASGCVSDTTKQNNTKNYSANGISFQYPGNWSLESASEANVTTIQISDPDYNKTNATKGSFVAIVVGPQTNAADLATFRNSLTTEAKNSGINSTTSNVNIAGISANATTFSGKNNNTEAYMHLIDFTKNNKSFIIFMIVGGGANIDMAKSNFDIIVKSFKVE